jgi:hypothetical protein
VARRVVGGSRRTCQEKLPWCGAFVDLSTHVIPDLRDDLPFVEQSRYGAIQEEPRIDRGSLLGRRVDVE